MNMMTFKQCGTVCFASILLACGGEPEPSETENALEELGNVLGDLSEELNEIEGVNEIYSITGMAAGDFELGAAIPETSDDYSVEKKIVTTATEEGPYDETVYFVSNQEGDLLEIKEYYDYESGAYTPEIGEMNITSNLFETDAGIAVGSTIASFIEAYPDYSIWYTYVSDTYVIETESLGAQFLLDPSGFSGKLSFDSDMETLSESDFTEGTEITAIRMYKL